MRKSISRRSDEIEGAEKEKERRVIVGDGGCDAASWKDKT